MTIIVQSNIGAVSGGGGLPAWTFAGSASHVGGGTFTSVSVGPGLLVMAVASATSSPVESPVSTVSFGAVSLTKATDDSAAPGSSNNASLWYGVVSAGSATVTITTVAGTVSRLAISYGIITGANSTPTTTHVLTTTTTTAPSVTDTVPTNGIAITAFNVDRTVTGSFSNTTLDDTLNESSSSGQLLMTHTTTTGSLAIGFSGTNSVWSVVSAAWGP